LWTETGAHFVSLSRCFRDDRLFFQYFKQKPVGTAFSSANKKEYLSAHKNEDVFCLCCQLVIFAHRCFLQNFAEFFGRAEIQKEQCSCRRVCMFFCRSRRPICELFSSSSARIRLLMFGRDVVETTRAQCWMQSVGRICAVVAVIPAVVRAFSACWQGEKRDFLWRTTCNMNSPNTLTRRLVGCGE
jgi:hypothetical protein